MSRLSPRISVLLPVRNGMPWLPAAIESVLTQTFADFELLVLEDGSTDASPEFLTAQRDPRIRVLPTGGVGIAGALNIGLRAASGEYIARHDADDESMPSRFERQVAVLDGDRDISVVATVADYIDSRGDAVDDDWVRTVRRQQDVALTPDLIANLMPLTCCVTHGSVMARTAVLRDAGGYRPEFIPADDYDLWLRLLPRHRFAKLGERLYRYRIHGAQLGAQSRPTQIYNSVLAKLQYVRRRYPTLPALARLAIRGGTRGDDYYRSVAAAVGFRIVDDADSWDLLAVTDFALIDHCRRSFADPNGMDIEMCGNLFVRLSPGDARRTA